jgi:hypothetical protein
MRNLIVAMLAVVVAACSGPTISPTATFNPAATSPASAGASPGSSAAVMPSSSPGASSGSTVPPAPTATPDSPMFQVFPPGAAVEVTVAELNLRRQPSTGSRRVQTLERGTVLIVMPADSISFGWGPVNADGYTWYPVVLANVASPDLKLDPLPATPLVYGGEPTAGWVASHRGPEPYLTAVPPRCPTTVDLTNVQAMLPAERLACFNEPITLAGTFGCGGCGGSGPAEFKPAWLASPLVFDFLSVDVTQQFGPVALYFHPDGPERPAPGSIIRATVHLDDPRSTRCSITLGPPSEPEMIDERTAILLCRERFVVDSYEVLGIDPNFLGG